MQILCSVQENYVSLLINKKRKFKFLSRVDKAPQNLAQPLCQPPLLALGRTLLALLNQPHQSLNRAWWSCLYALAWAAFSVKNVLHTLQGSSGKFPSLFSSLLSTEDRITVHSAQHWVESPPQHLPFCAGTIWVYNVTRIKCTLLYFSEERLKGLNIPELLICKGTWLWACTLGIAIFFFLDATPTITQSSAMKLAKTKCNKDFHTVPVANYIIYPLCITSSIQCSRHQAITNPMGNQN